MIRSLVLSAAALAAWSAASGARAADDGATADFRCLVVATAMAQNANPQLKSAGAMASFYYLGKLDGRTPSVDLESGLKQEMGRMTPQDIQAEVLRCGQQLQARGKAVVEIGARLQAPAAAKAP